MVPRLLVFRPNTVVLKSEKLKVFSLIYIGDALVVENASDSRELLTRLLGH
jgi:hypothetical protein